MGTYIAKNLIKTSIKLGKHGEIIEQNTFKTKDEEMKHKQNERAKKLGMRLRS